MVTIATDGTSLSFSSIAEFLEISCPICRIACEYSLIDKHDGLFKAHDWDADIDSLDLNGEAGEISQNLLKQHKFHLSSLKPNSNLFPPHIQIFNNISRRLKFC